MALDALLPLQVLTTKTATFSGAALDLKTGTPRRGMRAKVFYSAATNASGANNFVFNIDHSPDGTNWYPLAYQLENPTAGTQGLAMTTTAQAGELNIPFFTSSRYVRLTLTGGGAGSTPTITYSSQIGLE